MLSSLFLAVSAAITFGSPVNYPVSLAGNFGEPRPNHFHGGIDVRTGMTEGKPVFSVADGYVSRITVGLDGFGNALYVRHPNGITSVYCHLKKFTPQLATFVRKWQYKNKKGLADVHLCPTDYPVSIGQLIAVSGNTGASRAPHLHLEFHSTKTWSFLDPLQYLKEFVEDKTKPIAHAFMAYPVNGKGVFCGSATKQSYGFSSTSLSRKFTAWGKVGFGIWANDYMDGSFGILGVRHTSLTVDGKIVFESDVDGIPSDCNRMVNSWGDYDHFRQSNVWYMKSFIDPGNRLPILHSSDKRGIIEFNEERDYRLVYSVSDVFGNERQYSFTVHGRKQPLPTTRKPDFFNVIRYDRTNSLQRPGMSLLIRPRLLPDDTELSVRRNPSKNGLSDAWSFYNRSYPIFNWAEISLKLKHPVKDTSKLYIVSHFGIDRYMGGRFSAGWVTGRIRELGANYEIAYDDTPPAITGFRYGSGNIRIMTTDRGSGISSYYGYVDDIFVVFQPDKSGVLVCELRHSPIKRIGKSHNFKFIATDNRNNRKVFTSQFIY